MNGATQSISATAVPGIPLIEPGDELSTVIMQALEAASMTLRTGDVLVITSKIVSKSEGRFVDLKTVVPGAEARHLAEVTGKDARIVELILRESVMVSRYAPGVLVTQHRLGFVSANAGIDQSNVGSDANQVLLLPDDPDASARLISDRIGESTGAKVGVIISDSQGRPFRIGNVGVAIGIAGVPALMDFRGQPDLFGRRLQISILAYADLIASTAHLICGEAAEGRPVILVRGLMFAYQGTCARDLNRSPEQDLYR